MPSPPRVIGDDDVSAICGEFVKHPMYHSTVQAVIGRTACGGSNPIFDHAGRVCLKSNTALSSLVRIGQHRFTENHCSTFTTAQFEVIDVRALSFESLEREGQEAVSEDHKRSVPDDRSIGVCLYIL